MTTATDRETLARRLLAARRAADTAARGIPLAAPDAEVPCAAEQRRIWLATALDESGTVPPVTAGVALDGPLDLSALGVAYAALLDRHVVLRTGYRVGPDGEPLPVPPIGAATGEPDLVDLTVFPEPDREPLAAGMAVAAAGEPFDLTTGALTRLVVYRLAADRHRLMLIGHHIAADGWSLSILLRELAADYRALVAGGRPDHDRVRPDYADYAVWSYPRLAAVLPERSGYWRHRLAGLRPILDWAPPAPRSTDDRRRSATAVARVDLAVLDRLRSAVTPPLTGPVALLTVYAIGLSRLSGRADVATGVVTGGRAHRDLESMVGCFVNLLPVRVDTPGSTSYAAAAGRVREALAGAFAHEIPFDRIVAAAAPRRAPGVHPIVQTLFIERDEAQPAAEWATGLAAAPWGQEVDGTGYDLVLAVTVGAESAELVLTYPTDRFDRAGMARLATDLAELARALAAQPDRPLAEVQPWAALDAPAHAPASSGTAVTVGPADAELIEGVRRIWGDVLGRVELPDDADLFDLGGDSLALVRIAARITEAYGVAVPASAFFDTPTVAGFAAAIAALDPAAPDHAEQPR